MPILTQVGRNQPGQIGLRVGLYGLLTLGALAIVFPILIVIGQTLSDEFDLRDNAIVPYYLTDREELALKYIFKFSNKLDLLASRHNRNEWTSQVRMRDDKAFYGEQAARIERQGFNLDARDAVLADLNDFKRTLNPDDLMANQFRLEDYFRPFLFEKYGKLADELQAAIAHGETPPKWLLQIFPDERERQRTLADRERLGTAIMNHDLKSDYQNYYSVEVQKPGNYTVPFWRPGDLPKDKLWSEFLASLPPEQLLIVNSDAYWHTCLRLQYRTIDALNQTWDTQLKGFYELHISLTPPTEPAVRRDWDTFVVKRWPRRLLEVPATYAPQWQAYVKQQLMRKLQESGGATDNEAAALKEVGRLTGRTLTHWAELELPARRPDDETLSRYWCEFTSSGAIPPTDLILLAPETGFRAFLRKKYAAGGDGTEALAKLNTAWKSAFTSFESVPLPLAMADFVPVHYHASSVRWGFMSESYKRVSEYMMGRGQAAWNTFLLVALSLISALTLNPIAAYSLSRFPMKSTQKILIFFLATMAFPAEVAMIPNFLLLRDFNLLNTYWALILPGMANGFAIFLLKGFFDSLPRELYEAAEMDGASEFQVFRLVAVPLIKPILAYIGLNTFVAAYGSFMWAFVICPKEEMWTLMVWVYDFQMKNPGNNYIMAATVLVCLPPLVVFFFANRIIMRGIVIPSLK